MPPPAADRHSRLTSVLLWVGITAGVVFIVAVLFFSGFVLGRYTGWHRNFDDDRTAAVGACPMTGSGAQMPMNPGGMSPGGMGPGGVGPGAANTDPHHPETPTTTGAPRP